MLEFPELRLKRLPDTLLTARREFKPDTIGIIPLIRSRLGELLGRPMGDQHAQEFRCTCRLIQRLCIQPFWTSCTYEAEHNVVLERRDCARVRFGNHRFECLATLGNAAVERVKFIIPRERRLSQERYLMMWTCAYDRKRPYPASTARVGPIILHQARRAEYRVRVCKKLRSDQLTPEIVHALPDRDGGIGAQVVDSNPGDIRQTAERRLIVDRHLFGPDFNIPKERDKPIAGVKLGETRDKGQRTLLGVKRDVRGKHQRAPCPSNCAS